jgi:cytochrome c553
MRKFWIAALGCGLLMVGTAQAADLAAGKARFEKFNCASCHGADAKSPILPTYPVLAGQHQDYLKHALVAYQRGQKGEPASANVRKNAIMGGMAMQLSATDIENITSWLSSLPTPLSVHPNEFR